MLINQKFLLTPGPTPVPERVIQAMNQPMIAHRGKQFPKLLEETATRLAPIFGSPNPVILISGSGTGALETAASNIVEANDDIVVVVTGAFGDRFASICETFGANVHRLEVEWGKACQPDQLEEYVKTIGKNVKAVFATYCETSTGVLNPIQQLGETVNRISDALFVVDGVSCIGAVPVDMERWHIDMLVSGSQKALMLPPGLAFVALSNRAKEAVKNCRTKRFYLDLNKYVTSYEKEYSTPFTPSVSLIYGAREVCSMIEEEGFENVISRHMLLKKMLREGLKALDLPLLASDEDASPTVTAVITNTSESKQIKSALENNYGIILAGGQKKLKGEIFRIGHMGYCTPFDMLRVLNALEMTLSETAGKGILGRGISKAQEVWLEYV
ncbi:pyridoxal-phosphate-dependent aminotransferase family protein [Neobacillus terrae]|uniref:pyridoxal-phosphate-dependent aminotransferase family protein n=1 Tax=Neobacillus terrae TaxID=3034837 RepID=UPI00140BA9E1|nr:alanine--glyoxylate aminotransferase family protein [Neobacillus terrae]NHM33771.1 alanine--glyoxylate aminotransferase family protein [Neobacillus terrae]